MSTQQGASVSSQEETGTTAPLQWLGQWNGPEGTYLQIAMVDGKYVVTIRNLDGARSFAANAGVDGLHFERDGVNETIVATDGATTGMKWLASKPNCLTIKSGEGYCRD
ncbi:MAG: hypothetical protein QM808_08740 [Steroidobacteraceae bacterium]